jgi:hypothetical protein
VSKLIMDILSVHWDFIVMCKVLSRTARFYFAFLLIFGGYASYSLARASARLSGVCERTALARVERRVANVRQTILLLLLLFGMTVANDAFVMYRGIRSYSQAAAGDGIDGFYPWVGFIFTVFSALVFLHGFQWVVSARLQRRAMDLSG